MALFTSPIFLQNRAELKLSIVESYLNVKARLETIFSKGPCRDARVDDAVADADIRGLPQMLLAKRRRLSLSFRAIATDIAELFRPFDKSSLAALSVSRRDVHRT